MPAAKPSGSKEKAFSLGGGGRVPCENTSLSQKSERSGGVWGTPPEGKIVSPCQEQQKQIDRFQTGVGGEGLNKRSGRKEGYYTLAVLTETRMM